MRKDYFWQVKALGMYWRVYIASWAEWHGKGADKQMRRAWWWLWHWKPQSRSCIRVCGITLHSAHTPWSDYSEYGV